MSDDMRREEERLKWEKTAIEEMQNEVHYENLRFGGRFRPFCFYEMECYSLDFETLIS